MSRDEENDNNDVFGELRSLLDQPDKYAGWLSKVLALLETAYANEPGRYQEEFLPYLEKYPELWKSHKKRVGSLLDPDIGRCLEYAPFLRLSIEFYGFDDLGDLEYSEHVDRIGYLTMGDFRDEPYVKWDWFGAFPWKSLTGLDLINFGVESRGLERMLSPGQFTALEWFCLSGNQISGRGIEALATSNLTSLRELELDTCGLGDADLIELAGSKSLEGLTRLKVCSNKLGDSGVVALSSASFASNLEELDLSFNAIGAEGAKALAGSLRSKHLVKLDLNWNKIDDEGALAIANAPFAENLTHLDLSSNPISKETQEKIIEESALSQKVARAAFR